jgi:hypothetical protein
VAGAVGLSVLAGDIAQELGQLGEGGGNLDPLTGAGAAVELAGAVLAVLALDRGARAGRRPGARGARGGRR